jgi:hypothetical protein
MNLLTSVAIRLGLLFLVSYGLICLALDILHKRHFLLFIP